MNVQPPQPAPVPPVQRFFQRWAINTLAVLVAALVVPGIGYDGWPALLGASLVLGVLNALLRPLLLLLSLPLLVFTLGLFSLVINALLLYVVGQIVKPFHVEDFWAAFWGGLVISGTTLLLNTLTRSGERRLVVRGPGPPRPPRDGGSGPVIDV